MSQIMTIRPPEELRAFLKEEAKRRGYTVNQLTLQILWNWRKQMDDHLSRKE